MSIELQTTNRGVEALLFLTKLRDAEIEPREAKEALYNLIVVENNPKTRIFLRRCLHLAGLYHRRRTARERREAKSLVQRLSELQSEIGKSA